MKNDGLFITRKRKKWKFAHFNVWNNCFNEDEVSPELWRSYFKNDNPLTVEVGAGTADLSCNLAKQYPNRNFVAIDVKSDRLYTGAKAALQQNLCNVAFVRGNLVMLSGFFKSGSIEEIWITFPDPFSRKKQAKHRLTHTTFLQRYRNILTTNGVVKLKTDNLALFVWSLEQIVQQKWVITDLNFDLHASTLAPDNQITTAYERRFMREGVSINFVGFRHIGADFKT